MFMCVWFMGVINMQILQLHLTLFPSCSFLYQPGIPYRVASLEAAHGSFNETSDYTQPDASYDAHPGMPTNDWFQFTYQEGLTADTSNSARPLKWTMLSRNQIINAHTENWVLRYLSYEAIDTDDERKLWESYFDMNIQKDCGDEKEQLVLESDRHMLKLNRLGMFFSSSSHSTDSYSEDNDSSAVSQFDLFLAQHNKHYTRDEYAKRKEIHETNTRNIVKWNKEHAGKTTFAPHEFMDMEVKEVMSFRGGHIPGGKAKIGRRSNDQDKKQLRQSSAPDVALEPHFLEGFNIDEDSFTTYELPIGFDPTTLPASFDWREYLPGAVGAVKDQGICGSCWAFAFISAMESHWFITHGQAVDLPEQFVNDCAWGEGTHACDGGDASYAAKQIIERFQGVIPTRNAYGGYLSVDAECFVDVLQNMGMMNEDFSTTELPSSNTVKLTDYVLLPTRDDIATKHALYTQGPLSIAINVVDEAIYYSSGVLDVASCTNNGEDYLDHAVTVVGWGTDQLPDGTKAEHWIMRNSWSDLWGNAGYFRIRMGERDCGVTTKPGYPVVLPKEQSTVDVPLTIIAATS